MSSDDKVTVNLELRSVASLAGWERLWRWLLSPTASGTAAQSDQHTELGPSREPNSAKERQDDSEVKTGSLGEEEDRAD